jgi:hypothetical protein
MSHKSIFCYCRFTPGFGYIERSFLWLRKTKLNAQNVKATPGNSELKHSHISKNTDAKVSKAAAISSYQTDRHESKSILHSNAQSAAQI